MLGLINNKNFNKSFKNLQKKNFPYVVIDNFFKKNIAIKLEKEFPKYENKILHEYKNFCEIKKSLNNWNIFPPLTYKTFTILNSNEVIKLLTKKLKLQKMYADFGLNGGGWHMMNKKGKLNPHLDYFIHPKINKQRKDITVVDLHIDKLIKFQKNLKKYEILSFQLKIAKKKLDLAILNGAKRIIFIHGVGQGILKFELEKILRLYNNLEFYPANFKEYGYGATEVSILTKK